mmetsp:Transcript_64285/g.149554  ORF Transcript_64285/g.149554 Transcript_64285/m.149554 type:complete len:267 (-) Transcript_64285:231-1031(-)
MLDIIGVSVGVGVDLEHLQLRAALLLGAGQQEQRHPHEHQGQQPARELKPIEIVSAHARSSDFTQGLLHQCRPPWQGNGWECCAFEVHEETLPPLHHTPREKLRTLERENEVDELVLITLVYDNPDHQKHEGVDAKDWCDGQEIYNHVDRIPEAVPDPPVVRKKVVPEVRADAVWLAAMFQLLIIELVIPSNEHLQFPNQLRSDVRPDLVDGGVERSPDKLRHVLIFQLPFDERWDPLHPLHSLVSNFSSHVLVQVLSVLMVLVCQ